MRQRVHLITLGVADLERAAAFYDALGWTRAETPPGIVAYDLFGATLGLYPVEMLARDLGRDVAPGSGSVTLSCNTRTKEEVAGVLTAAEAAGATVLRAAHDMDWGGHGGFFADPDGVVWEVTFNPFSALGPDDEFQWGGV